MNFLDNFLSSGHSFSKEENLIKFRFSLLNSILIIAAFFTLLNYFAVKFGFIHLSDFYQKILLGYILSNILTVYILRKNKKTYVLAVNIIITYSFFVFYNALVITTDTDEFRLIWFFLLLFASFVLMGKIYGLILMILILLIVFVSNHYIDLAYSKLALFTFFNSFIIFSALAYFFLQKIEKDSIEFERLNKKLKAKVSQEIQQREEQEQMFLHQSRLAGMGEMIDSIAHQWRQPLMTINAILMNVDRALETKDKSPKYMEYKIDEVITLTTYMSQTIEDFRSLFKEDKTKNDFYVDDTVTYALELLKDSLKGITIHYLHQKEFLIYGYKNELVQVLMILLGNASETLNTRKVKSKRIEIKIKMTSEHTIITIEDSAGGVREKNINKIFDPYFTTKERTGGTGLGLYVAKIIIEQNMQGTLNVSNTKQGAKFEILLPKS